MWIFLAIFLDYSYFLGKSRIFTYKQVAYAKLWCDVGTFSSTTLYGLYLNIGITFFILKLLAYPNLWWDVGNSSSITLYGLYPNIGITFFLNLAIFGNIFGFLLFFVKKSNFHIQTTGISKVVVGCWHLLFYYLKWTIPKHWNHIFHESRYSWQYFWISPIFCEKVKFSHST